MQPRKQSISDSAFTTFRSYFIPSLLLIFFLVSCAEKKENIELADSFFNSSISINKAGRFIEVPHSADYLPNTENNFLFFSWINLKTLPSDKERLVLFSKYSGRPPNISGYALALRRDGSIVRPVVYWGDGTKSGRWLDFPEIQISAGEWHFFALHVHKGNFIGLFSYRHLEGLDNPVVYHGSHEVEFQANGEANIIFGAVEGRDFKGKIGPFGIINPFRFRVEEIQDVLSAYIKQPQDFSIFGPAENARLLGNEPKRYANFKAK